jgi:hypothetical protein
MSFTHHLFYSWRIYDYQATFLLDPGRERLPVRHESTRTELAYWTQHFICFVESAIQ